MVASLPASAACRRAYPAGQPRPEAGTLGSPPSIPYCGSRFRCCDCCPVWRDGDPCTRGSVTHAPASPLPIRPPLLCAASLLFPMGPGRRTSVDRGGDEVAEMSAALSSFIRTRQEAEVHPYAAPLLSSQTNSDSEGIPFKEVHPSAPQAFHNLQDTQG